LKQIHYGQGRASQRRRLRLQGPNLKTLAAEVHGILPCTFFGQNNLKNLSYNDGKAVYINEPGLYSLIMHSKTSFAETFQDLVLSYK